MELFSARPRVLVRVDVQRAVVDDDHHVVDGVAVDDAARAPVPDLERRLVSAADPSPAADYSSKEDRHVAGRGVRRDYSSNRRGDRVRGPTTRTGGSGPA